MLKCVNTKAAAQEVCQNNLAEKFFFFLNVHLNQELSENI